MLLTNGFNYGNNQSGRPLRIRYYTETIGSVWDDERTLVQSGATTYNVSLVSSNKTGTHYTYSHSGISSTLLGSFTPTVSGARALTIDSNNNLIEGDSDTQIIFVYSGISNSLTGSFATPSTNISALTIDSNNNLISADIDTDYIYLHSGVSDTLTGSFAAPGLNTRGLGLDLNNNLISESATTRFIYNHSGISSNLTGSFNSLMSSAIGPMCVDKQGNMIISDTGSDYIYVGSKISNNYTGSFATPGGIISAMGTYNRPVGVSDLYLSGMIQEINSAWGS